MKRRAWLILAISLSLGVLVALAVFFFEPVVRIDPASFAQVRDGMSEAEVNALLGAPSGIEIHPPGTKVYEVGNGQNARFMHSTWQYEERRRIYLVYFDDERKVMARQFLNIPRVEDRLLFWLGGRY